MYEINIHKQAGKVLKKAQRKIKNKAYEALSHMMKYGLTDFPFKVDTLKGKFQKYQYFEIKIDKDFRIIFRQEGQTFFIRSAGTHNQLGTG